MHTDDHVGGILYAIDHGVIGEIYNIGVNNPLSNLAITELIMNQMSKDMDTNIEYIPDRAGHDRRYCLNSDKLKSLGWQPTKRFFSSFYDTVLWYNDNKDWWLDRKRRWMLTGPDCPKYKDCANADTKCFLCHDLNCFKPGKNVGKGRHHEKQVKKQRNTKAELRRGSGNVATAKGDLIDDQVLHEAKSGYTRVDGKGRTVFSLQRNWLLKIGREALQEGRIPVLEIHFDSTPDDEIYAVLPATVLFDLLESLRKD